MGNADKLSMKRVNICTVILYWTFWMCEQIGTTLQ